MREGLGHILAQGFHGIIDEFGEKAKHHAPSLVKGMHTYAGPGCAFAWDLFGTMELGQLLEPRGPHVGSGGSPTYFARRPLEVFPRHLALREDFRRGEEIIPDQWIGASGFKNYLSGKPLTREDIKRMVQDYYEEWGWDRQTGVPTPAVLKKLEGSIF